MTPKTQPGMEHLPVLPLSEVLKRLSTLDHASTRELRDLTMSLGVHVVNLSNKIKSLEGRLDHHEEGNLEPPVDRVDFVPGIFGAAKG